MPTVLLSAVLARHGSAAPPLAYFSAVSAVIPLLFITIVYTGRLTEEEDAKVRLVMTCNAVVWGTAGEVAALHTLLLGRPSHAVTSLITASLLFLGMTLIVGLVMDAAAAWHRAFEDDRSRVVGGGFLLLSFCFLIYVGGVAGGWW